jgi:Protein of unknown function (DUF616)
MLFLFIEKAKYMNNKVIFTSVVGDYDSIKEPRYRMPEWDYICFSNTLKQREGSIWKIEPIPFQHSDNSRLSRYAKINPHLVLKKYEYSLWIDANIEFLDDFVERRINELIKDGILLSLIPHPFRNCIYQEAQICITDGLDSRIKIQKLINFLKDERYPENNGMFENGLIFRRHNDQMISSMNADWWSLYLRFSKRDQLSLGYVLWKNNISCERFVKKGKNVRNMTSISYVLHKSTFWQRTKIKIQRKINRIG